MKKLVALMLALLMTFSFVSCSDEDDVNVEYELKLSELMLKKQKLNHELSTLSDVSEKYACMSFIFTELDSGLYDDVLPILHDEKYNIVGVMAFSPEELPGLDGKITEIEYRELISYGWGTAIYWNGEGDLGEYITSLGATLDTMDIELPVSIIFEDGTYKKEYDAVIQSHGIENAIHSGDEGDPLVESTMPEGVWHPGCMGWRTYGKSTKLKSSIETVGGYALFRIVFENTPENVTSSFYPIPDESLATGHRSEVFIRMINSFKRSLDANYITVDIIENAREEMAEFVSYKQSVEDYNAKRRVEIQNELADIDRQITELYNEYY